MDSFQVKIKRNNRTYKAKAYIDRGILTVNMGNTGVKSAAISSNNNMLAGMLLREILSDVEKNN
ncbi:MAG: hypothetical protein ISEC1_P0354 [Thiomicrorhabdus sp.]|nr:MAG: hypothetical protein ISEC1_P0354 [Thiomicrorhabdus sp.]